MNPGVGRVIHGQSGKGASSPRDGKQHPNGAAGEGVQGLIRGFVTGVIWGGVVAATGLAVVSQVAPLPGRDGLADGAAPTDVVAAEPAAGDAPQPVDPAMQTLPDAAASGAMAEPGQTPEPLPELTPEPAPSATAVPMSDPVAEAEPEEPVSEMGGGEGAGGATAEVADPAPPPEVLQPEILQKVPEPVVEDDAAEAPTAAPEATPDIAQSPAPNADGAGAVAGTAPAPAEVADESAGQSPEEIVAEQMLARPGAIADAAPGAPQMPAAPEPGITLPDSMDETVPGLAEAPAPAAPGTDAAPQRSDDPPAAEEALLQPAPAPDAPPAPALIVPDAPLPTVPDSTAQTPEPDREIALSVPGVRTDRLPRIGDDPAPAEDGMDQAEADGTPVPELLLGTTPLELFRRAFENPDAKPLFGIILIDDGIPAEERSRLAELPFAVSFALDPLSPDSAEAARVYRDAGQEVVMLANGIPQGATPGDLEQTFQALDMAMPEAVAVLDRMEGGFQDTLDLARQAVPIVAEQGRGIVTYDRGLNSADQVARREGVPRATIFRVLDSEGESIPKMRNYLDRAAFKAAQEGRVLVIGRARAETVAAILEWTVEGRAASVALAPISAVLEKPPSP